MRFAEIPTVPNAVTLARGASIPKVHKMIVEDPGENWWKVGLIAATDRVDGFLAGLGDRYPLLYTLGFRRSEFGRKIDPSIDKGFTVNAIAAGMRHGVIPKGLGVAAFAQKAATAAVTLDAEARGEEIRVRNSGRLFEAATVTLFGLTMATERIKDPDQRKTAHTAAVVATAVSIGGSVITTIGYARQSGRLPEQPSAVEEALERVADYIFAIPGQIIHPGEAEAPQLGFPE